MAHLFNSVWVRCSTSGLANFTTTTALSAYQTPVLAGVVTGQILHYSARTETEFENGEGVWNSSTLVLTRDTIFDSSNAGAKVNFASAPTIAIAPLAQDARDCLSAARSYYVRTDGSDSNTGLANTSAGAFLTWQKAYDVVCDDLDTRGFSVVINVAAGTYTGASVTANKGWMGGGSVTFAGAGDTTIVDLSAGGGTFLGGAGTLPGELAFQNFLITLGTGHGVWWTGVGQMTFNGGINFSDAPSATLFRAEGNSASIGINGNWSHADCSIAYYCNLGAKIQVENGTITLSAAWTSGGNGLAQGDSAGIIRIGSPYAANAAFSASTGIRYYLTKNMVLNVGAGTANAWLPGSINGSANSGSQAD